MGLRHDKPADQTYFFGIGPNGRKYNPIMGGAGSWQYVSWSDGRYPPGNVEKQNDISEIQRVTGRAPEACHTKISLQFSTSFTPTRLGPLKVPSAGCTITLEGTGRVDGRIAFTIMPRYAYPNLATRVTGLRENTELLGPVCNNPYTGSNARVMLGSWLRRGENFKLEILSVGMPSGDGYPEIPQYGSAGYVFVDYFHGTTTRGSLRGSIDE